MKKTANSIGNFVKTHQTYLLVGALLTTASYAALKTGQVATLHEFLAEKDLLTEFETFLVREI